MPKYENHHDVFLSTVLLCTMMMWSWNGGINELRNWLLSTTETY